MPRRPRPAPREKPSKEKFAANVASSSKVKLPLPKAAPERKLKALDSEPESDDEDGESSSDSDEEDSEEGDSDDGPLGGDTDEDGEESDVDVDAPRVSQWVDDEDLEELDAPPGDTSHGKVEDIVSVVLVSSKSGWFIMCFACNRKRCRTVRQLISSAGNYPLSRPTIDLASLPLGALRRAQRALARAQAEENPSDSEDDSSESGSEPEQVSAKGKESNPNAHKPEWSNKPRTDIAKRGNKNAWVCCFRFITFCITFFFSPIEVTSKKPVTRRRQIVEVPKMVRLLGVDLEVCAHIGV